MSQQFIKAHHTFTTKYIGFTASDDRQAYTEVQTGGNKTRVPYDHTKGPWENQVAALTVVASRLYADLERRPMVYQHQNDTETLWMLLDTTPLSAEEMAATESVGN